MKISISNAKVMFSKAVRVAQCRFEIGRAVLVYTVAVVRLKRLHPVRHAMKRENVCYQLRASQLAFELAADKLNTI
uniref:Uncharacterized protein n=1 Tax=Pseudomonas fluorescens (strain SBW25) TaxID=216595 RepID=A0A0G4E446_PSEFS|nr:hypothetical protein [Pseudomonas fluorescens]CEK42015.1 hypothetical protein PQBR57_0062 [Pseudomonas fluorescens SBW25]